MNKRSFWSDIGVEKFELLDQSNSLAIFQEWKATFCPELDVKRTNKYAWESIIGTSTLEKEESDFDTHESIYYYILAEPRKGNIEVALTKFKPNCTSNYKYDFYTFPKNMAWCMCLLVKMVGLDLYLLNIRITTNCKKRMSNPLRQQCVATYNKSMLHNPLRGLDGFSARSSLQNRRKC